MYLIAVSYTPASQLWADSDSFLLSLSTPVTNSLKLTRLPFVCSLLPIQFLLHVLTCFTHLKFTCPPNPLSCPVSSLSLFHCTYLPSHKLPIPISPSNTSTLPTSPNHMPFTSYIISIHFPLHALCHNTPCLKPTC